MYSKDTNTRLHFQNLKLLTTLRNQKSHYQFNDLNKHELKQNKILKNISAFPKKQEASPTGRRENLYLRKEFTTNFTKREGKS